MVTQIFFILCFYYLNPKLIFHKQANIQEYELEETQGEKHRDRKRKYVCV